jgi:hypothetical protein
MEEKVELKRGGVLTLRLYSGGFTLRIPVDTPDEIRVEYMAYSRNIYRLTGHVDGAVVGMFEPTQISLMTEGKKPRLYKTLTIAQYQETK